MLSKLLLFAPLLCSALPTPQDAGSQPTFRIQKVAVGQDGYYSVDFLPAGAGSESTTTPMSCYMRVSAGDPLQVPLMCMTGVSSMAGAPAVWVQQPNPVEPGGKPKAWESGVNFLFSFGGKTGRINFPGPLNAGSGWEEQTSSTCKLMVKAGLDVFP